MEKIEKVNLINLKVTIKMHINNFVQEYIIFL